MTTLNMSKIVDVIPVIKNLQNNNKFDLAIPAKRKLNECVFSNLNVGTSKNKFNSLKTQSELNTNVVEFQNQKEDDFINLRQTHLRYLPVVRNFYLTIL